ncbi:MAG: EAL domain-containing protein [Myxococcota bacterium]|nr:EAL domain-containing protein [Myxococcota bacterium]
MDADRSTLSGDVDGLEALKASTIMMVDDEPTTLEVLELFLEGEGYTRLVTTTDSREALDLFRETGPDLLLLDLMMPNVGGLEILDAIRSDPALQHTPVIILTSSTDAATKLRALELGATDFLGKPVDPSELALRLRNTLAAKAYRDRLAHYDRLTGLPNRRFFMERIERALRRARAEAAEFALLQVNLDRFKQLNDTLGHTVGDSLLKTVAERLEKCVRPGGDGPAPRPEQTPLCRAGGDEFWVLLRGPDPAHAAARVARRILGALGEPVYLDGRDLFLTAGVGIAVYPGDAETVETLISNAGVATSHAKRGRGHEYQFYDRSLNEASLERLSLENDLRRARERRQLHLYYQPKVDVKTGRIIGAEALMRWKHPELGTVPPNRFIPIAEETGLIESLGEWAINLACGQNEIWQRQGLPAIRVAVNVSSKQFRSGRFRDTIRGALRRSGLDAKYLILELTESMIMENPQETAEILHEFKAMGVKVSVDDFGTGYSSLASLKRFPLDELKIDRSFVQSIPDDADDAAIVTAIVAMAQRLGLSVVAEGVETEAQLDFLRECGCDVYQGYLCSRPVAPEEWVALMERTAGRRGRPSSS